MSLRPVLLCVLVGCVSAGGLPTASAQDPAAAAQPRRHLAPGILTVIPPSREASETFSGPRPLVEVTVGIPDLDWTPKYEPKSATLLQQAQNVTFRRAIWNLEFAFKPLRMIEVDVPQTTGKMQRKLIWYMVYRVRNIGYDLNPVGVEVLPEKQSFDVERVNYPTRRFFPHFVLESHEFQKQYLDRLIPAAKGPIQARENPGVELLNSIEISQVEIPLSDERFDRGVWGFVTWEDIDPRIDFFSLYVRGLTNAFQFEDPPGGYTAGSPPGTGRKFTFKALQLNFWRPGDTERENEREIHYGVPVESNPDRQQAILDKYGLTQRLDYRWVYR